MNTVWHHRTPQNLSGNLFLFFCACSYSLHRSTGMWSGVVWFQTSFHCLGPCWKSSVIRNRSRRRVVRGIEMSLDSKWSAHCTSKADLCVHTPPPLPSSSANSPPDTSTVISSSYGLLICLLPADAFAPSSRLNLITVNSDGAQEL